ncbi:MAG: 2Fe-2S iron-sulfur cluster-binding protein, partial [Myxococcales bacterium]|nr:2Fe-2S iron-sulfur cluster-binding protein [Myxococcales bacterium]
MARFTVDGVEYETEAGTPLLRALDELGVLMNGVDVPHYCWHPKLSVDGSCRLCQVEIEGEPKLQIACDTPVRDGMVVRTDTERVRSAREGVMELLLLNHPLDCPICDQAGECRLQDHAFDYGVPAARTREPRRAAKKRHDLGREIVFDQERCILCRRCVRFCREVTGTNELGVLRRGDRSVLETAPGHPLDNDYSMNVADICPVGALTTKDFRFKVRVWDLENVPGVCTGCSRGCNVEIGVARGEVQRYVPRRNDAVNETWLCDAGRLSYKEIGAPDRVREVSVRGEHGLAPVSLEDAIAGVSARVRAVLDERGGAAVAGIASAHACNEDLRVFAAFLDSLGAGARGAPVPLGPADELLVRPEKAANAAGARALGFGDPAPWLDRLRVGDAGVLIVLGHDLLGDAFLGSEAPLSAIDTVVLIDTHQSPLVRVADFVFPARHPAEREGTLTN